MVVAVSVGLPVVEAAVLAALVVGVLLGLACGWQARGHHELGRRRNDIDLTGARRP